MSGSLIVANTLSGVVSGTYNLGQSGPGGSLSAQAEYIAYGNNTLALFTQYSGTNTVTGGGTLCIGNYSNSNGSYSLQGGNLTVPNEYIGYSGTGAFWQSGGTHNVSSNLSLGYTAQGNGTYVLGFANSLLMAGSETIGYSGTGSFFHNSGTNVVGDLYLGLNGSGSGVYQLNPGAVLSAATEMIGDAGTGIFYQNGGTNSVSGSLMLSASPFAFGQYVLYGGLLSLGGLTHAANTYSFGIGSGTIQAGSSFATNVPIDLFTSGSNGVFDTHGNLLTLNGFLFGFGGLQKVARGTLILTSSSSDYTGPTTLTAGTLEAANGNSGSATGSNTVTLNGGVLAAGPAGGTISGEVVAGSGPAHHCPGRGPLSGYGTLNLNGGLITNNFTKLLFNLNSSVGTINGVKVFGGDLINLGGQQLDITGGQIALANTPTQTGYYRLFDDATLTGGTASLNDFILPNQGGTLTFGRRWLTRPTSTSSWQCGNAGAPAAGPGPITAAEAGGPAATGQLPVPQQRHRRPLAPPAARSR